MFGKYRICGHVRFTVFLTFLIIISFIWFANMFGMDAVSGSSEPTYITVAVKSGDTLWSLAETYGKPDQDIRRTVYEIAELNGMESYAIYEGQLIRMPE